MEEKIKEKILSKAKEIEETVINHRRQIHKHPEIRYQEHKTAELVAETLEDLGITVKRNFGDMEYIREYLTSIGDEVIEEIGATGVVGILKGTREGKDKTVLLRADMDALPLQETKDPDHIPNQEGFRSENDGVMHACGHDAHVAMLLGAAHVLSQMRDHFSGTVKFLFQPAEEKGNGAMSVRKTGVLDDVDVAYGIHVWSPLKGGQIKINDGPMMAAVDKITMQVKGGGGHASAPHETEDPLSSAIDIVNGLYKMKDREISTLDPAVLTVTIMNSNSEVYNIIPNKVEMAGTIRSFDEDVRSYIVKRIEEIGKSNTALHSLDFEFKDFKFVPPTLNTMKEATIAREAAKAVFGEADVESGKPVMGGEDFSYILEMVPGAFMFLGVRDEERGITAPHHNEKFDLDESQLYKGVALHTAVAIEYFSR